MKLSRTGVRTLVAMGMVAAGLLLSGRTAQADCGRSAANDARPVFREAERNPPATLAESRAADYRLSQYRVMPCPDDSSRTRDADYRVFNAWQDALRARDQARVYGETYPDPHCPAVGRAREREQLVGVYDLVFTRRFRYVKASPDALHVADFVRREARAAGQALPPPWTVDQVRIPVSRGAIAVQAHVPHGVVCGL